MNFVFGILGAIFVADIHQKVGLSNEVYYVLLACFENALGMAFFDLPIMSLFAKITPPNIEGTIFAMLTGFINLSSSVLAPLCGTIINSIFFNVTTDNL